MKFHIVLLFGENQFALSETVRRWKSAFIEKYNTDFNIDEFEGITTKPNEIVEACQALPFLGEKRLVIVKNFLRDQSSDDQKRFAELLNDIPDSCALLLVEDKMPDQRTSLFKKLQKNARLEHHSRLEGDELTRWIVKTVEERGGIIDWKTAIMLGTLIGDDSWKLHHELEKLLDYTKGDPITGDIVDKLTTGSTETNIFKLTDALGQKQPALAIQIFHQLVERGEELPMIYAMIVRQIRLLIQIHEGQNHGLNATQIAQKLKQHPFAVKSILPQCRNFNLEELKNLYQGLLNIDLRLKTGAFQHTINDQRAYMLEIERFIAETGA